MKYLKLLILKNDNIKSTEELEKLKELNKQIICYDHKVHIRFRDYDKEEYITGLENKLTFVYSLIAQFPQLLTLTTTQMSSEDLEKVSKGDTERLFKHHLSTIKNSTYEAYILPELWDYFNDRSLEIKKLKKYKPSRVKEDSDNSYLPFHKLFGNVYLLLQDLESLNFVKLKHYIFDDSIEFKLEYVSSYDSRQSKSKDKLNNKLTRKVALKDKNKINYSSLW
mgnify:CR=1 FL=1